MVGKIIIFAICHFIFTIVLENAIKEESCSGRPEKLVYEPNFQGVVSTVCALFYASSKPKRVLNKAKLYNKFYSVMIQT